MQEAAPYRVAQGRVSIVDVFRIVGGKKLVGSIEVPGSKNAALALLSAIPLARGRVTLSNLPDIADVRIKVELLKEFGITVEWEGSTATFDTSGLVHAVPPEEIVRPIRTGFYLFGPLIARNGHALLPMPGGCDIGARPVDFHLKGLRAMGAVVANVGGMYEGKAERLRGADILLDFPSAGATQHLMATACMAEGYTVIRNAAMEPEVTQLAQFLRTLGADITGAGTSVITIKGTDGLHGGSFRVPSDRIQAGTYLLAGAITRGHVRVVGIDPEPQKALVQKLAEAGLDVIEDNEGVMVSGAIRPKGVKVKTMPYPGFPTDIQQPFTSLMCLAEGSSTIEETLYEKRIGHVRQLVRMGAKIEEKGRVVFVEGVEKLQGAHVEASDLRAGAALVLAGLAAEGETVVSNIHFVDRGYQNLVENLTALGATIERLPDPKAVL